MSSGRKTRAFCDLCGVKTYGSTQYHSEDLTKKYIKVCLDCGVNIIDCGQKIEYVLDHSFAGRQYREMYKLITAHVGSYIGNLVDTMGYGHVSKMSNQTYGGLVDCYSFKVFETEAERRG